MRGYRTAADTERFDPRPILKAIKSVLPLRRPLHHHAPSINGKESQYVGECLASGLAGYQYVDQFQDALARRLGVCHCVATSSGTSALQLALLAAGVRPGDEVLVPSLTFAATANAVIYTGATPNFVDGALAINPYKLHRYIERTTSPTEDRRGRLNKLTGRRIWGLIVVHLLGQPADTGSLVELCHSFGLEVIEDAAEALGSYRGNRAVGTGSLAAIFSFNQNKIVTTNCGGCVVTDDELIASKCYQLASTARIPHKWLVEHDAIGFNYAMGNLNAALGLAQLERLGEFMDKKRQLAAAYRGAVSNLRGVQFLDPGAGSNNWLSAIVVDPRWVGGRDEILALLHADGILARCLFTPLHLMEPYRDFPRDRSLLYAEDTAARVICLPSGVELVDDRQA